MSSPVRFERHAIGGQTVGALRIANPPVNALSPATVAGLIAGFAAFEADAALAGLLLYCDGRTWVAGGDIASFDDPAFAAAPFNDFLARMEGQSRPVVGALHGTALGGGLELALACHFRVALPGTQVGLPEVKLGLLPGSLGTQRLPRLAGAAKALEMTLSGRMVGTDEALAAHIVDAVQPGEPLAVGLAYLGQLLDQGRAPRRSSALSVDRSGLAEDFFAQALAEQQTKYASYPARAAIVRCAEAAATLPFAHGAAVEAREFMPLVRSPESAALRHLFFAERAAARIPGLPKDLTLRPVKRVGILGAGTMGGGIAMNFANAGIPTTIVEAQPEALQRGLGLVRRNYEASAAKGKLTAAQVEQRMGLLTGTLDLQALAGCDLVIEAVFENMDLKRQVMAQLGAVCRPGAIIATNTSTLDVDALAAASGRPADVVGMHFFSPANVMRLLEVVRGAQTAPAVLATVMKLAGAIGKVAVVSGVCYGFIGNRMAEPYMREAERLLLEGATPAEVDAGVESLGFAMGPCRMLDLAGVDVGAKTVVEWIKAGGAPADAAYRIVCRTMLERGLHGQKTGQGYYRYEGRQALPSADLDALCAGLAAAHGVARRGAIARDEVTERLLYPLINEGVKILEEGIAYRPGDVDIVWTKGYGFPDFRGGPMHLADVIGLQQIVARLDHYAATRGNAHGDWTVAPLLRRLAAAGQKLSDWKGR